MRKVHIGALSVCLLALLLCGCAADKGAADALSPEEAPVGAPASAAEAEPLRLRISEVMSSNKACLADNTGRFPDWVELENWGESPLTVDSCLLTCGGESWQLPGGRLEPGEHLLLRMALSADGEDLTLLSPTGSVLDKLSVPALGEDQSWQRQPDGSFVCSAWPSPGYDNSEEGYIRSQENGHPEPAGPEISEVMAFNAWYLPTMGAYYDWVEIANPTQEALTLSDYYLSDKGKQRLLYRLPEITLEPGACTVVLCDADVPVGAPFGLSAERETLYLSRGDGTLCDYVSLHDIPYGCSYGRRAGEGGFFYFDKPSPGEPGGGGARLFAKMPALEGEDGVFDGVNSVTVTLTGKGDIRYTLDGSEPTGASELYTKPLELTETTVLRAVCYMPDRLRSEVLTCSFIINEEHSLPVVSLVCDPEAMFGRSGIYTIPWVEREIPGTVELFEQSGEGVQIDCGIKLHGATSKLIQQKKSLKLCFRSRYEGTLHYDLFGNGVLDFASILLRADQESSTSSYMHDNLMHELAIENFPALPAQDGRYAVLYINGAYWGIYSIREAHSEEHYANHYGYDADTVSHWHEKWPENSEISVLYRFAMRNDLRIQENFDHVAEHLNTDSIIAWAFMQLYSGNFDFNSPNMRFYWSEEDQQLRYALVDLDLGLCDNGDFGNILGYQYAYNYLIGRLLTNEGFRRDFLRQCADMLSGPFSDEAVLRLVDEREATLEPEIERDMRRWNDAVYNWRHMVEQIRVFIRYDGGRAQLMEKWLRLALRMSKEEIAEYFG